MARTMILPAVESYCGDVAKTAIAKKGVSPKISCAYETDLLKKLSEKVSEIAEKTDELEKAVLSPEKCGNIIEEAEMIRDSLPLRMSELRVPCDEAELLTAKSYWPFPTYSDLMFGK